MDQECGGSAEGELHSEYSRNRKAPDSRSLHRWHDMLLTTGSVQNVLSKRSLSSLNDENMERVEQHFEEDPHTSIPVSYTHLTLPTIHLV